MIFIELHSNVPLGELVCRTHGSAMQIQCQWVMEFCGGGYGCPTDCCLVCDVVKALDGYQNFVFGQYLQNKWTGFDQILYML